MDEKDNTDSIWCDEGGKQLKVSLEGNGTGGLIFETIDTTKGFPGKTIDKVTIARFRLKRIKYLIDKSLTRHWSSDG